MPDWYQAFFKRQSPFTLDWDNSRMILIHNKRILDYLGRYGMWYIGIGSAIVVWRQTKTYDWGVLQVFPKVLWEKK